MPQPWFRPSCIALAAAAWVADLFTPQLFVVAILLNVPIALSSLALDSAFTRWLVVAALAADASAGYFNGVHDGYQWSAIAIGDRVIAALSFLLVGTLSNAAQHSAARAGELAARQDRAARERSVRRGVEAIRASVNPELIKRAIVREALGSFDVDAVRFYAFDPGLDEPTTYAGESGVADVDVRTERPEAPILSFLHRIAERHEGIGPIGESDAFGRLVLATLGAEHALTAALIEHETTFGVLVLLRSGAAFDPHVDEALAVFVDQAAIALAQAALFVQLGERNDELAVANGALRERGDVIRDIVYALSHDLRTPLTAARMTMRQALDGAYGELPAPYREILVRTIASNEELQRLAETLLLVSRYESGEQSTARGNVALATVARSVVAELEPLWSGKHLAVGLEVRNEPFVLGNENEVRRAISNLLANAVTWTPAHREVAVRIEAHAGVATIAVDDRGYGVPDDERATLFERVRAGPGRHGAGSGLGLYLVRRIAEGHGGRVSFSPREGGGSTFAMTLPAIEAPVPA